MACIVWQLPDGTEYRVAENQAHRPPLGAFNTGKIDWTCKNLMASTQHEVDAMMEQAGVQWGSAIKWVTQKIGVKQCSACKAREVILNNAKKLGWTETMRQIAATYKETE